MKIGSIALGIRGTEKETVNKFTVSLEPGIGIGHSASVVPARLHCLSLVLVARSIRFGALISRREVFDSRGQSSIDACASPTSPRGKSKNNEQQTRR